MNYYSSEEDVLDNADGGTHIIASAHYAWMNQETRKGVWPMWLPGNNEGGWGFANAYKEEDPYGGQGNPFLVPIDPIRANAISDDALKVTPFFGPFDDMAICTTNSITVVPALHQLLADAIPAESYAAGRNPIPAWLDDESENDNIDLCQFRDDSFNLLWTHSLIKEAAYRHISNLFKDIVLKWRN